MRIVYASCVCSKRRFIETFLVTQDMPGQQVQKYHRLMLEGLALNDIEVIALTSPPITRSNSRAVVAKIRDDDDNGVWYRYLPILNFPIVRNFVTLLLSFAFTCRYLHEDEDAVVVCDVLNVSVSTGALLASKLYRRISTGIVTDIPALLSESPRSVLAWLTTFFMVHFDSYVFLTEPMNSLVNRRNVPYVVIEGQVDIGMEERPNDIALKRGELVCLYAGAIDRRYGIEALVQGFLDAAHPGSQLRIYGRGDYEAELVELAQDNPMIAYFGTVPNDVVVDEELRATLLVNPRPTTETFTRYSFPSKNMEYMASGTPLLATLLPGMPDEYLPYIYVLGNETPAGVAAALDTLLATDPKELHRKGGEAREFVLQHKNNVIQAQRVLQLIRSVGKARKRFLRPTS